MREATTGEAALVQAADVGRENAGVRAAGLAAAGAIVLAFAYFLLQFWLPVHGGVDQNGYMVGGRQLAATGSMALRLHRVENGQIDPLQFVSPMWVGFDLGTHQERFIPKYPVIMAPPPRIMLNIARRLTASVERI